MLPGCPAAFPFKVRLSLASQPLACCVRLFLGGALLLVGSGCTRDFNARLAPPGSAAIVQASDGTRAAPAPALAPESCLDLLARQAGAASDHPNPDETVNRQARQSATSRLMEVYGPALLAASRHQMLVRPGAGGDAVWLRLRSGSGPGGVDPSLFASLVPAERYVVPGVPRFNRVSGEGSPLVGTLRPVAPVHVAGPVPVQPVAGITWAVTVVPRFRAAGGGGCLRFCRSISTIRTSRDACIAADGRRRHRFSGGRLTPPRWRWFTAASVPNGGGCAGSWAGAGTLPPRASTRRKNPRPTRSRSCWSTG